MEGSGRWPQGLCTLVSCILVILGPNAMRLVLKVAEFCLVFVIQFS